MRPTKPNETARWLFGAVAPNYEKWAAILSLGQDARWRRAMVDGLALPAGARVLDVAAGTGSISLLLERAGHQVVAVDLSQAMISEHRGRWRVLSRGERLPFADDSFDAVTFGYLLRYVDDPATCLRELRRVLRPGGVMGMVEFGLPTGLWYPPWQLYTGGLLPAAGRLIDPGWWEVGRFLRSSIEEFHRSHPDLGLLWSRASPLL
ncbi:MAG: class I SAM-dependent methyltransferase, partial [Acidimicrobiia bacterium]|nr:class I SAM-dependent methyltransferase [Acidimicrobiia bacterium]